MERGPEGKTNMEEQLLLFDPEVLSAKLDDAMTPGMVVELDPGEAEVVGAFFEDAISEEDALASTCDLDSGEVIPGQRPGR